MSNGTWKRTTTEERRKSRQFRYAHVSVNVSVSKDPETGMLIPTRTPKGEGSTATRKTPKRIRFGDAKRIGHDWPGNYFGRLASVEKLQRDRRNAKINAVYAARRAAHLDALKLVEALSA